MPEETKMSVETVDASPVKKQTIGKMALAKVTMLDGTVMDVNIEVPTFSILIPLDKLD